MNPIKRWLNRDKIGPPPPKNVRVLRQDGTVIPLEMIYVGDDDGAHVWESVNPVVIEPGDRVTCDVLPGHTTLRILGS